MAILLIDWDGIFEFGTKSHLEKLAYTLDEMKISAKMLSFPLSITGTIT